MNKLKVAYFGGGPVGNAVLRYLAIQENVEVVAVAAWKRKRKAWWEVPDIAAIAGELRLPTIENEDLLNDTAFDVLFSVYYDQIIRSKVLALPKVAAINLHGGPLPEYRGRFTFLHAILNGESQYGATLHLMDEGMDTGAIIAKRLFSIGERTTAKELYDMTSEVAIQLFKDTLATIVDLSFVATPQEAGTYTYRTGDLPDGEVNLSWDSGYIDRYIRALYFPPFDPAFIRIGTNKFFLHPAPN